jgi:hypothetical protein
MVESSKAFRPRFLACIQDEEGLVERVLHLPDGRMHEAYVS